jgi:hypothetical protein
MGFLRALDRPYVNPFYHSQEDEEPDDVVKEEDGLRSSSSPSDHSPDSQGRHQYQERYGHDKNVASGTGAAYDGEKVDPDYQAGVQKAEGVTLAWNKRALWLTYIWYAILCYNMMPVC